MKIKTTLAVLTLCIAGSIAAYAADPNVGTWKLNEAKSKIPAGASKNNTVTYTEAGDQFKCVVDGVDGKGQPAHNEWTGKFDGKDYPLVGDPAADTRAIEKVSDHKYKLANKKGGKVTASGTIEISKDDKTRTLHVEGTAPDGKKIKSTQVYDKQ